MFAYIPFGNASLVCFIGLTDQCLIVLPETMMPRLVKWYHEMTLHSEGMDWLELTIK
jgi:hypothetical protein